MVNWRVYTYKCGEFTILPLAGGGAGGVSGGGAGGVSGGGAGAGVPVPPGFHSHAIINKTKYLMILGIHKSIKLKS